MKKLSIALGLMSLSMSFGCSKDDEDTVTPFCEQIAECNEGASTETCVDDTQRVIDRLGAEGDCDDLLEAFEAYVECGGDKGQCTDDIESGLTIFAGVEVSLTNGLRGCDEPFSEYLSLALNSKEVCQEEVFTSLEDDDAPAEWTCFDTFYGGNGLCDCGCGIQDPECADAETANLCDQVLCANGTELADGDTTTCVDANPAPDTWTCTEVLFADGSSCDCGCGVMDPDCEDEATTASCDNTFCTAGTILDEDDLSSCVEVENPDDAEEENTEE